MPTITVDDAYTRDATTNALVFQISISEPSTETVTVSFLTRAGTAVDGSDFTGVPNRRLPAAIEFQPGETTKTISILQGHASETEPEDDESVILELYNPSNADFGRGVAALRATGWITQDGNADASRAIQVSSPMIVEDDGGRRVAEFRISLSQAFDTETSLDFTTLDGSARAGVDYRARSGTLDFAPGQLDALVRVPVLGDRIFASTESFRLAVTPTPDFADRAHGFVGTATILDDDAPGRLPTLSIERGTGTEAFSNTVPFMVRLSEPSEEEVTVRFRTVEGTADADSEYFARADTVLTFEPGGTSKLVAVNLQGDPEDERDETVLLELSEARNARLDGGVSVIRQVGWILDDDNAGTTRQFAVANLSALEQSPAGTGEAIFQISLSEPSDERITLQYRTLDRSAKEDRDFVETNGRLVFEPGQTDATVTVRLKQDYLLEGPEAFGLAVAPRDAADFAPSTAGTTAIATIVDAAIVGTDGNDRLLGTAFSDAIFGLAGADTLRGRDGSDRLAGGSGADRLRGDEGADRFIYKSANQAGLGPSRDVIEDFERKDRIDLSGIDANEKRDGNQRFEFIGDKAFSETRGELSYRGDFVAGDTDGDGLADFQIFAEASFRLNADSFLL